MGAGVLDVGIRNPGEHFLALGRHLLGCCVEIRKYFDGHPGVSHQRRNAPNDLLVFVFLFFGTQGVAGRNELLTRVLAGETEMFEIVMRLHSQRLYRVARAILRNDGEAETPCLAVSGAIKHLFVEQRPPTDILFLRLNCSPVPA